MSKPKGSKDVPLPSGSGREKLVRALAEYLHDEIKQDRERQRRRNVTR
jgi:hypothetical protein